MSYDDVYDDEAYPGGGRVLWGRIAFFAVALIVAFFVGGALLGGGADPDELTAANQQIQQLSEQNAELEQQVSQLSGGQVEGAPTEGADAPVDEGAPEEPTAEGSEAPESDGGGGEGATTYTVQSGDTLIDIAEEVYGSGENWQAIAEANGLDEGNPLVVGQELQIPPNPGG